MKQTDAGTHGRRAVIELREKILGGELPGGMRLTEVGVAEALDISRTPVREAMSRLAEEGLLERAPNGGFTVRRFSLADVVDAIEVRGVMEGMAARVAAERGARPEDLAAIKETLKSLDACFGEGPEDVDFDTYTDFNTIFHQQMAALARSEIIAREVERASLLPFASPSAFLPDPADISSFRLSLRRANDEHHEIVDAIELREGSRADAIARAHARTARRNLEYILKESPDMMNRLRAFALVQN